MRAMALRVSTVIGCPSRSMRGGPSSKSSKRDILHLYLLGKATLRLVCHSSLLLTRQGTLLAAEMTVCGLRTSLGITDACSLDSFWRERYATWWLAYSP